MHMSQTPPPVPQAPFVFPARQLLPEQHPEGHELESHTQFPPEHRWPAPHGEPLPHRQLPLAQVSARVVLHDEHPPPPVPQAFTLLI